jgi:hypothetical protein
MAKKVSRSRRKTVPSLKGPLALALRRARSLRGKVVEKDELDALINHLVKVQRMATESCPVKTFYRAFSLKTSKKR